MSVGQPEAAPRSGESGESGERSERAHATSEVLSIVSHDIRAPLGVILGAVAELTDPRMGGLSDEQRNLLRLVRRSSERLSRLAANVQFLARAETGALTLTRQPLDARDLARRAVESLERSGETAKLAVAVHVPGERVDLSGEADLAVHAVINVLANAVRFARRQVTVTVAAEAETTTLVIEDDGPGIPEGTLARLFDPRTPDQSNQSTPRGLGLLIVKAITDAHGGTVTVQNRSDDAGKALGARVRLAFPRLA